MKTTTFWLGKDEEGECYSISSNRMSLNHYNVYEGHNINPATHKLLNLPRLRKGQQVQLRGKVEFEIVKEKGKRK